MKIEEYKQYFQLILDEVNVKELEFKICICDGKPFSLVYDGELYLKYNEQRIVSEKLNKKIPEFCKIVMNAI